MVDRFARGRIVGDDGDFGRIVITDRDGGRVGGSDTNVGIAGGNGIQGNGDVFIVF